MRIFQFLYLTPIIVLMLLYVYCDDIDPLSVVKSGLFNIGRGDVGIVFYIAVRNLGLETYHVVTKMIECCETITNEDTDCQFIQLLGGNMGFLSPNKTRNFTLIFPNMYPHNRRGECDISVWFRSKKNVSREIRHRIPFNTYISDMRVPSILKNYFKPSELSVCQSPDQDPLDNCLPVNCHQKYMGSRSYYNHIRQKCEKIPICMSDPKKDMPDVAYVPISNTCRDLETAITEDDVHFLTKNTMETKWKVDPPLRMTNMRCHHGHMDNETGFCVCDPGWQSTPFDRDQYNPSTLLYHMCTIQDKTFIHRHLFTLLATHYPTIILMNFLMSICLIIMIFFGHSLVINYQIASSQNRGKKYIVVCVLINILIKLAVNIFITNFLVSRMESLNS